MPTQVLVIVVLPTDTTLLDSDLAGRPAGRYLPARLAACEDVVVQVAAGDRLPAWCDAPRVADGTIDGKADGDAYHHRLTIDGRSWLSQSALTDLVISARQTAAGSTLDAATVAAAAPVRLIDSYLALATAEQHLLVQRALAALERGVRIRDPHHVYLRGELACGAGVELDIGVIVEGRVVLGDRVRIGAHAIVRECRIGDDTVIHPFSIVEHSTIGKGGFVGPYGRVRPGSAIGDGVQIGNYVELKRAHIGDRSRINHHSFIGDAVLADRVTIGAGTITCNHDGTATNETVIDSGAYIGSGCNLVAPLHIGRDATVGAGSTITRDVPASKLTLARTVQTTVENWQGPRKK